MAELCRKHNVTPNAFYGWKDKFLEVDKLALAGSLKNGPGEGVEAENESLKKLIGKLTIANDCLKKAMLEGGRKR